MGKRYEAMTEDHRAFIARQKIYFVATATADSRINLSPKGLDSLRVLGPNRVVWLNLTGSGNESAAHVRLNPRMTLMFCAFEGDPMILRLYGAAKVFHPGDAGWSELLAQFPAYPGVRQIFDVAVDLVQTSCGAGVPLFGYGGERNQLLDWHVKKGEEGVRRYWAEKNQVSLDGLPSGILPGEHS